MLEDLVSTTMYRLWRHRLCRSALHNKNFCSPLLFTATKTKYAAEKEIVEESRCAQVSDYLTLIFLLSNNNRDWGVIFLSLPYRMTSSSPFNCETPNLILKVMNRQEKDFFQKLEHSLFSEIGLNSWFKKIWQFKQHVVHFHSYTMSGRLELDVLIDILQNSFDQTTLQTRVLQWDEKLPIPDPPPLRSLVEHLVRRRLPSCATSVQNGLNNLFVHSACRVLGLRDAHKRYERARTS